MLWQWLIRLWRVEVALWNLHRWALRRNKKYDSTYCINHSLLLRALWFLAFMAVLFALGMVNRFLQGGYR